MRWWYVVCHMPVTTVLPIREFKESFYWLKFSIRIALSNYLLSESLKSNFLKMIISKPIWEYYILLLNAVRSILDIEYIELLNSSLHFTGRRW